jgi:hypothetical protein
MHALRRSDDPEYGALRFGPERLPRIPGRYSRLGVANVREPFFKSREVELIQKALTELDRESAALASAGSSAISKP